MNNFIIYSIEIAISLALFYSAYWVFLKNETFFKLNRFYLLSSVAISLLVPVLNITVVSEEGSFITKYLIVPIEQYEQRITGDYKNTTISNEIATSESPESIVRRKAESINRPNNVSQNPVQSILLTSNESRDSDKKANWLEIILLVYVIGVALFFIRFIANFIWIFSYAVKHKTQKIFGMKVIRLKKDISPFSFLNLIFMSNKEYPESELTKIISHEKVHIQQKHSIDLILLEMLLVFQWFNPFVWFYKRAINVTHEYLADQGTLNSGVDLPDYQYSLLNQALGKNKFEIASNYNLSVKKRITMMTKKRSSKLSVLKLTLALPILIFLCSAFAFNTNSSEKEVNQNDREKNKPITYLDTSIKKVNVSREYLKLLEGEYTSTNEPNGIRKIKFTEVLGTLMANDNGYRYRIIPIGDGKFTNPDDKASFVFNTKDKNAISLSLFGKINLNKMKLSKASVDFPKKSIAYSLADVMEKDGIPVALIQYKAIKDSGNYDLNEIEMNFVGYLLLESGKTKEAASIFKLNSEAFPNSFNTYDSYGEALLALGDKTHAIESYKKSVQLNPGSKSGLKVLKELGVNTDSLIKTTTVSMEYLKSLEGEYISTNEPNGVRKIRFTVEEGVLEGNDHGYHYKLIPMGDGKFINPDDGASLAFNTKDKQAITLLLFGKINLKKLKASEESIKKINVSVEYLKQLEGEYISTNQPNGVRRITFVEEKGILVGNDDGYRYKLIPVGDGKFINPDDDASLVFDTKDKNAITLLLFGKINLKKVK